MEWGESCIFSGRYMYFFSLIPSPDSSFLPLAWSYFGSFFILAISLNFLASSLISFSDICGWAQPYPWAKSALKGSEHLFTFFLHELFQRGGVIQFFLFGGEEESDGSALGLLAEEVKFRFFPFNLF